MSKASEHLRNNYLKIQKAVATMAPEDVLAWGRKWASRPGYKYSFGNTLLAWAQFKGEDPLDMPFIQSRTRWENEFKREVKDRHQKLWILKPIPIKKTDEKTGKETTIMAGFKNVFVYEYGNTEGEPIEYGISDAGGKSSIQFDDLVKALPVPVRVKHGMDSEMGYATPEGVLVAPVGTEEDRISTLLHEWCHFKLHFIKDKQLKSKNGPTMEVEADTFALMVGGVLGIEKSPNYVAHWKMVAQKRGVQVEPDVKSILSLADQTIKLLKVG